MVNDTRRQLAQRIHLLLRRELGQGIDVVRTVSDPLYARDVLLVCDAMPGSELAALSRQYRDAGTPALPATTADDSAPSSPPSSWPRGHSDFDASRPAAPDSQTPLPRAGTPSGSRRWLSPARWLGRT